MNFIALISGGKDSIFTAIQCIAKGYKLLCLANLHPQSLTETDSFMYQTVGSEMIEAISKAIEVPLFRQEITGTPIITDLSYSLCPKDEVEDLYILLSKIKGKYQSEGISVHAVCAGAILSTYQKLRVQHICKRLGLECLTPIWQIDQDHLLKSAILNWKVEAIITKVCTLGLDKRHLGGYLKDLMEYLNVIVFY